VPATNQSSQQSSSQPPSPQLYVNDNPRTFAAGTTLLALLGEMALAERPGVAVAVNDAVVSRADWNARTLHSGDRVLVIHASQGG